MQFIVSSEELLKHLKKLKPALPSKPVIPILNYFLLELNEEELVITATDLEVSIKSKLKVTSSEKGKVAIPSNIIIEALLALPYQPITIDINQDSMVEITSETGKYKFAGENAEDFPAFPKIEEQNSIEISSDYLIDAFNNIQFSVGNDDFKPALTGIYFDIKNENTSIVSSDGNRLAVYVVDQVKSEQELGVVLPKKVINIVKTSLPQEDIPISVKFDKTNAWFSIEEVDIVCRLIEEQYPKYNAAFPENIDKKITIEREELLNALKRISIFANKNTNMVTFDIKGNRIKLKAQDIDYYNEAYETINCEFIGEDIKIGFNSKHLIDILSVFRSHEITLEMGEETKVGIIKPIYFENEVKITMLVIAFNIVDEQE